MSEPLLRIENLQTHFFTDDGVVRAVDGVSYEIRPGETLAVVGPNGAGKTTFVKLLAGLYRPDDGRITVDGVDLAHLDLVEWRARISAVFADFVRYPASLADNVALSAPTALYDRAGVTRALDRAGGGSLLTDLPGGLDALLWRQGTDGVDLSGGQWQRVAIARALFAHAHGRRLLVFDEPTANLDVRAEAAFHERVVAAARGASTVLISHRMSTVRPADRIVVLRDGRVAEEGDHETLMAVDGDYARSFRLQAARFAGAPR
jgi:ATP-binding cassette subfamily B protein